MVKGYATVQIDNGVIYRVDTGAPNRSALNKLDELGYVPLVGAVSHGEQHPGGASFTLIFSRGK